MKRLFSFAPLFALVAALGFAQTTTTQTTLTNTINRSQSSIVVGSTTGITGIGTNNQVQTVLVVDREAMDVQSVVGSTVYVVRGTRGGRQHAHNSSAVIWVGPPGPTASPFFADSNNGDTSGSCTATSELYLPRVYLPSGNVVDCLATGPGQTSIWVTRFAGSPNAYSDGEFLVPPGACSYSVSAHAGTLVGLGLVGGVPTMQAATTASASTDTVTIACTITPPFRTTSGRNLQLTSAEFLYGVQTTNLGTQAATLASGTFNSVAVFQKFVAPAAGASETASSATLVRADSGTLVISPAAASFNATAVTAGQFYNEKFTPASPIVFSDLTPLIITMKLVVADGAATQVNSPGIVVHFTNSPL